MTNSDYTHMSFEEQRYDRLKEVLSEYLDDDENSSTKFLDDLKQALLENVTYFQGRVDTYKNVQDFFQ